MKHQKIPHAAQKIIARAPHLFTDREELHLAMRATIISGDTQRRTALQERADELRDQWRTENAEKIAELEMEEQRKEALRKHREEVLSRMADGDPENIAVLTSQDHERMEANNRAGVAEAEAERLAHEITRRDNERRRELRDMPFEKSRLATLASSTPRDFVQELGRSENYITDTAKKLKLQKTAGRWVFTKEDAKRLYDRLTGI